MFSLATKSANGQKQIQFLGRWAGAANVTQHTISGNDNFGFSFSSVGGLKQNDLLIVGIGSTAINMSDVEVGVLSAGYTEATELYTFGGTTETRTTNLSVSYKVMGATPDSIITAGYGGGSLGQLQVLAFRNVDPVTPLDRSVVTSTATNNRNVNAPGATTISPNAVSVSIGQYGSSLISYNYGPPVVNIACGSFGTFAGGDPFLVYISSTYTVHKVVVPQLFDVGAWDFGPDSLGSWAAATLVLKPAT